MRTRPHPPTPPPVEGEELAVRTTDEPISDFASHKSVDFSEDIRFPVPTTPSPAHSRAESRKEEEEEERGYFPVAELSDNAVETDFDSDISGLLSDGDYVPSSALRTVGKGRASAFPFAPSGHGALAGGVAGGVASKEGTPPRIQVEPANSDDLQGKLDALQDSKPEQRYSCRVYM